MTPPLNTHLQAFQLILAQMNDPVPLVKDSVAWTIGRICELLPHTVTPETLPQLMDIMCKGLSEPPKIAANICWAIHVRSATLCD
jgi:importin subunit beta-1